MVQSALIGRPASPAAAPCLVASIVSSRKIGSDVEHNPIRGLLAVSFGRERNGNGHILTAVGEGTFSAIPRAVHQTVSDLLDVAIESEAAGGVGNSGQANFRTGGWNGNGEAGDIAVAAGCGGLLRLQSDDVGAIFSEDI